MENNNEKQQSTYANNITSQGVLQLRLETKQVLEDIKVYLKGSELIVQEDNEGNIKTVEIKTGERKVNDIGVQSIVGYISEVVNPQTVQANFTREQYQDYIEEINWELLFYILRNQAYWKIRTEEIEGILGAIMKLIQAFMTRPIDNKERDSYGTIQYRESNTSERQGGRFDLFGKNR